MTCSPCVESVPPDAFEYISALLRSQRLGDQVAHHRVVEAKEAAYAENKRPWPKAIRALLAERGIDQLFTHQALATDLIRSGRHVVVATPTASGKSFVYNLPVLERFLADPESRGLYLFPLKALAQDQLKAFNALTEHWPSAARPEAAIYDGDTSAWFRKKIRERPPNALLTNPEMVHLSICPHHELWAPFLAGLTYVVVDEAHTYRGVMGSHMAQVFRRFDRVCARFGAKPTYIFCSATIGNPHELARQLTGLDPTVVSESGAPQGRRHFVFINPHESPATAAILLLQAALHRGLRTIVYAQSRKMTELISLWVSERAKRYAGKISAYRAGYLPEERREIEAKLTSGELLAVISTSALELGIDIGALDLCILVGYPGSIMSTLQRGGRVGRSQRESVVALIAQEDALDQYYMRNPNEFFEKAPECAVLNPYNEVILARHLECAAAELPLPVTDPWLADPRVAAVAASLEAQSRLLRGADGATLFCSRKSPHRDVDLRGAGASYQISLVLPNGEELTVGHVDEARAFKETHPGAIYIHRGESFVVQELDFGGKTVRVAKQKVDYFTRVRTNKVTEILATYAQKTVWGARMGFGKLKVTETITGYEKRRVRGNALLTIVSLDLPELTFETEGLWFEIPSHAQQQVEKDFLHFMGGIHALEHAAIGVLPLLVMTDRNDLGGISTPMHAQLASPAVFIYDGAPGGVGLTREAFGLAEELFNRTLNSIEACPCELGCPSCVHSPKCGSGNRPIDKAAALALLRLIRASKPAPLEAPPGASPETPPAAPSSREERSMTPDTQNPKPVPGPLPRYAVLDVETQRSAAEVGGWGMAHRMRVSVAVLYDSVAEEYVTYEEERVPEMLERLEGYELIVGFNILRFDYKVLSRYTKKDLRSLPTLDMLEKVKERLNYRISLDNLAQATLNAQKSADGLQALQWWKEGKIREIAEYCRQDVAVTRDLYLHGREHGWLLFSNKAKQLVRAPVDW
jgi:DEAD/DEAH box helicase domain-containing protein